MSVYIIDEVTEKYIRQTLDVIVEKVTRLEKKHPLEDEWLDSQEVCEILKCCSRNLQAYRNAGKLSFSQTGSGSKIYYRTSDIQAFLMNGYKPSK